MEELTRSHIGLGVLKQIYIHEIPNPGACEALTVRAQPREVASAHSLVSEVPDVVLVAVLVPIDPHEGVQQSPLAVHLRHGRLPGVLAHRRYGRRGP